MARALPPHRSHYGDEGDGVCECGHTGAAHASSAPPRYPCGTRGCDCELWRFSMRQQEQRALLRRDLDLKDPDGHYLTADLGRHPHPSYCRICKTKLSVTSRGAVLCLTGRRCDTGEASA